MATARERSTLEKIINQLEKLQHSVNAVRECVAADDLAEAKSHLLSGLRALENEALS